MDLQSLIFQRLTTDETLGSLIAAYDNRPAVFYQRAPAPDNPKWGKCQYPRVDFIVDTQENPARNTSGTLTVNVWCDLEIGAEPEEVEMQLRDLLHCAFVSTDDNTYCIGWGRSDAFEQRGTDGTVQTTGVTLLFDLIACPVNYTIYPDPIKAMNTWTKDVLPQATVIGIDGIDGWLIPTKEKPVIYWRLSTQDIAQRYYTHTWLSITMEGHVYARDAASRLENLAKLNTAQALAGHVPMEDTSPLFLRSFNCKPSSNYIQTGQITASGWFGVIQPQRHFSNKPSRPSPDPEYPVQPFEGTDTYPLNHANRQYNFHDDRRE